MTYWDVCPAPEALKPHPLLPLPSVSNTVLTGTNQGTKHNLLKAATAINTRSSCWCHAHTSTRATKQSYRSNYSTGKGVSTTTGSTPACPASTATRCPSLISHECVTSKHMRTCPRTNTARFPSLVMWQNNPAPSRQQVHSTALVQACLSVIQQYGSNTGVIYRMVVVQRPLGVNIKSNQRAYRQPM